MSAGRSRRRQNRLLRIYLFRWPRGLQRFLSIRVKLARSETFLLADRPERPHQLLKGQKARALMGGKSGRQRSARGHTKRGIKDGEGRHGGEGARPATRSAFSPLLPLVPDGCRPLETLKEHPVCPHGSSDARKPCPFPACSLGAPLVAAACARRWHRVARLGDAARAADAVGVQRETKAAGGRR